MLIFVNLYLVCRNFSFFRSNDDLCIFIGYQPYICTKILILVQKVSFWEIDHSDLLDFSKKSYYILSAHIYHKLYINVIVTPFYESFA